jgi:hypothetical protein
MDKLLTISYWVIIRPGQIEPFLFQGLVIFIAILVLITLISYLLKKRKSGLYFKIWAKLNTFSLSNFIIGLFLLFFIREQLPFLAMRLWLLVWILSMLVWLGFIVKQLIKIPEIKKKAKEEKEFQKYIP